MSENPYRPNTPEYRVHEIAQCDHGLSDDELLRQAGWVPHDGTWLRDGLLAQYRQAPAVVRFEEGLKLHATDWAYNWMRSDLDEAQAYGDHMVALQRAGELTAETSHKTEYPAFVAQREAQADWLGKFTQAYAQTQLWANTEEVENGEPTGDSVDPNGWQDGRDPQWALSAFTPASRDSIREDCAAFANANRDDLKGLDPEQAGHDFALTRNHHGAGFWDRGLGARGDRLTVDAHAYGSSTAWYDVGSPEVHLADEPVVSAPEPVCELEA